MWYDVMLYFGVDSGRLAVDAHGIIQVDSVPVLNKTRNNTSRRLDTAKIDIIASPALKRNSYSKLHSYMTLSKDDSANTFSK